jgi:hypothetical protein
MDNFSKRNYNPNYLIIEPNHFSLKGLVKDIGKMAAMPITLGVSSVTGKKPGKMMEFDTKAAKVAGGVFKTGSDILHTAAKSFGDTVTLGYASKAANLLRKDENKEKAYQYGEMAAGDTGLKVVDKVGDVGKKIGVYGGALFGGAQLGKGIAKVAKKTGVNSNILNQGLNKIAAGNNEPMELTDTALLDQMVSGNEDLMLTGEDDLQTQAGFLGMSDTTVMIIAAVIFILLILGTNKKGGYRRR